MDDISVNTVTLNPALQCVEVSGDVDIHSGSRLKTQLYELVAAGHRNIIIDLTEVRFIDSTGLGLLLGVLKRVKENSGRLALVVTSKHVMKLMNLTGLVRIFDVFETRDQAEKQFA